MSSRSAIFADNKARLIFQPRVWVSGVLSSNSLAISQLPESDATNTALSLGPPASMPEFPLSSRSSSTTSF